jgi:hypothetical protein
VVLGILFEVQFSGTSRKIVVFRRLRISARLRPSEFRREVCVSPLVLIPRFAGQDAGLAVYASGLVEVKTPLFQSVHLV